MRITAACAWPSMAAWCCAQFATEAMQRSRVVPFGLASLAAAVVGALMTAKRLSYFSATEEVAKKLERAACRAYLWLDLGLVELSR